MGVVDHKICRTCQKSKPLSQFFLNQDRADSRTIHCKRCLYNRYGRNYVKVYLNINRFDKTKSLVVQFNDMVTTKVRQLLDRMHKSNRITDDEYSELLSQLRKEGIFDANRPTRRTSGPATDSHSG